jgi:uncharacterized membrane protein
MDTKTILMEIFYFMCGLMNVYIGMRTFKQKDHPSRIPTMIYWFTLGLIFIIGRWIPSMYVGILIVIMTLPAMFNKVIKGNVKETEASYSEKMSNKLGMKIFIPALSIGVFAIIFGLWVPKLGALVGTGIGAIAAAILMAVMANDKVQYVPREGSRLLEAVGPINVLPQLLASLGAIFTAAGVGEVISGIVGNIIPEGNLFIGVVVYGVSMALFTMIMGNGFAAFSVITVGIGVPFVISQGYNPSTVGLLALTCGYCGTLMTPMAANFNIVPIALLEMKDKYGVIKKQIPIGISLLIFQILYIYFFGKM